ncbi:hypothetical protein [Endobacterium cereale]|nr:hypothetical protein [Endobacterium cereale]
MNKDMSDKMDQQPEKKTRCIIEAEAATIIRKLPALGNLMIIGKANGATHERIGPVERIDETDGWLAATGEHHASRMDPSLVCQVILDTSSIMQNQVYPRLDFQDGEGKTLFAFVGFAGEAPFEAALADLARTELEPTQAERPQRPDVAQNDPGAAPLKAAIGTTPPMTIAFESRGFVQSWTGIVEKLSMGMGFINIMRPDFHLHLLGGTVSAWLEEVTENGVRLAALDADNNVTGLTLSAADATAFVASEQA